MAALMKGLISIETLAEMPLPFVHILRDERIKQLEAKRRQNEIMTGKLSKPNDTSNPIGGIDTDSLEELVEGLN